MIKHQKGVGLVEILVALLLLAIGVLGFIALQYRAMEATAESGSRVEAMTLARDLAERIRVNRSAIDTYETELATAANQTSTMDCLNNFCSAAELADYDVNQVVQKARSMGMTMNYMTCQNTDSERKCVYVAWGDTSATNGTNPEDCTSGTSYNPNSTCVIMEVY